MPGTVTVGCKLPNGLHLNVFDMLENHEPVMGGGMRKTQLARFAARVTVKGIGRRVDDPRIVAGAALTHNVDADHWARWLAANKDSDVVKNGLIFAAAKAGETEAQAKDHVTLKTGLEPIDPSDLPAEFKQKIETAKAA